MVVDLTYACNMGCTHCMSDCKPDGQRMSIEVFKDTLGFLKKYNVFAWNFSGGEIFEHPNILEMLDILEKEWKSVVPVRPLTFITNGRELVRNRKIYERVLALKEHSPKKAILIQVTDDPRYYPNQLTEKECYWLKKLGAIIDAVPQHCSDKNRCLYPQGRALENFTEENWLALGPKCANCCLIAKQGTKHFADLLKTMLSIQKFCTPVIGPDGYIRLGESALCPPVASIYDSDTLIMDKIRNFNCRKCQFAWNIMKKENTAAYEILKK